MSNDNATKIKLKQRSGTENILSAKDLQEQTCNFDNQTPNSKQQTVDGIFGNKVEMYQVDPDRFNRAWCRDS